MDKRSFKKIKAFKIACLLLAFIMALFATGYTFAWFANSENQTLNFGASTNGAYFDGGDGTESNPYGISTQRHMYNLAWLQNTSKFSSKKYYFELKCDVDMSGMILPPIGNDSSPFTGVFNGKGYTIKNITISTNKKVLTNLPQAAQNYVFSNAVGVFGVTGGNSEVKNFILLNPTVEVADCNDYNAVASTDSEPSSSSSPKSVGLAIGFVNYAASSIGVYGGKMSVRVGNYETINSILGKAKRGLTINITGGSEDSGIFSPNYGTKLETALNKNAQQLSPSGLSIGNSNGLWVMAKEENSVLGAFTVTSKPTVNGSITIVGTDNVTVSSVAGNNAYNIQDSNGDFISTLTGYLAFSGVADCYSYDNIIDEDGNDMSSEYKVGAHTVKANSIKFNIGNNVSLEGATVYVIASSNADLTGGEYRSLGLYKTTDGNGGDIDYSNPDDFYELYECSLGHSKYTFDWQVPDADGKMIDKTTLLYHNAEKDSCGYREGCQGTIVYDNTSNTYRCSNYAQCGYELSNAQLAELTHTDTCTIHGGTRKAGLAQSTVGKQLKTVVMCNAGETVYSTNFDDIYGISYSKRYATSTSSKLRYTEVDYNGNTVTGGQSYAPLTINPNAGYKFNANYDGQATFHIKAAGTPTLTVDGDMLSISVATTTDSQGQVITTMKDYTLTTYVNAGTSYTLANVGENAAFLCYTEFVSCDVYKNVTTYYPITACTKSNTEHQETDFGVVQKESYAHEWSCKYAVKLVSDKAKFSEINYQELGTIAMNSRTPVYYEFTGLKKGSYQLSSTGSGIRIYYLRVDSMVGGNSSLSNIYNIDFVYEGVSVGGTTFLKNNLEYTPTRTRITFNVTTFNSSILLCFYRDESGNIFNVGYNPAQPTGKPTYFIKIEDTLTVTSDYLPTVWEQL